MRVHQETGPECHRTPGNSSCVEPSRRPIESSETRPSEREGEKKEKDGDSPSNRTSRPRVEGECK